MVSTRRRQGQRETPNAEVIFKDVLGMTPEQVDLLKMNARLLAIIQTFGAHDAHLKETKPEEGTLTSDSTDSLEALL